MKKLKDIFTPALILTIICVVLTIALATTNLLTKDIILEGEQKAEQEALSRCIKADSFKKLKTDETDGTVIYQAIKDKKVIGYAFSIKENGYGGDVSVIVGVIDSKVTAVEITDVANETPGLGQNVTKPNFTNKFKGVKSADEVDSLTGATITSSAVKRAVDKALELYSKL